MIARARIIRKPKAPSKRPPEKDAPKFLKWVAKEHFCILADTGECMGIVMACHWDEAGDKGMGSKVSDRWSLPMCAHHHHEQTDVMGWPEFQRRYKFDAEATCAKLWNAWPGLRDWTRALAGNPRTRIDAPMVRA